MTTFNLVYFPYAGGNAYSLENLRKQLDCHWRYTALEYPGHGTRWADALVDNIHELTIDLHRQLLDSADPSLPWIFLGYSFGGLMAFKLASLLEQTGNTNVHGLITVSARPPVHLRQPMDSRFLETDQSLTAHLLSLGGIPERIVQSQEMMSWFLPIIKSDLSCYAQFDLQQQKINMPILSFHGRDDALMVEREWGDWQQSTHVQANTGSEMLDGRHFCHIGNEIHIATRISEWRDTLSETSVLSEPCLDG
ncbi:thioesterase II family protein [Gynuella sunshinyii]|uniref:Putative thioesterase involved in non-ribosomal peptide biosynthesis n=1 Tax=Gynuella sunshinyii YC6258 TaxID=1445510 RepID=A0A0C5VUT8_9GAMM|nr:alpha/beta fold hydrolase [Gynuella sunshinyii]AJQ97068.1 putative thioesterase involved in non-ribosomal peptide biosynthesis [Gynuella sunshinyii YC6258]